MILYFIVISSSDISWTVVSTMSTSISLMCVLMLLVVNNVTGKKYIVETEEDPDLYTENDEQLSRGFLRIKRNLVLFLSRLRQLVHSRG